MTGAVASRLREGRTWRRVLVGSLDQAASSGSNFIVVLLVARTVDTAAFGLFAILFGILTAGLGLGRGAIGTPLSLDVPPLQADERYKFVGKASVAALSLGVVVGLILVVISLSINAPDDLRFSLAALGLACPLIFVQDTLRYYAVAMGQSGHALLSDGVWFAILIVALVGSVEKSWALTEVATVTIWISGGAIGLLLLILPFRNHFAHWRGTFRWIRSDRRRLYFSLEATSELTSPLAVSVLTAVLAGSTAVGTLRGASTLFGKQSAR